MRNIIVWIHKYILHIESPSAHSAGWKYEWDLRRKGVNIDMDARELTLRYNELREQYQETKKTVDYLEQEVSKLRMLVDDMRYDLKDMQGRMRK